MNHIIIIKNKIKGGGCVKKLIALGLAVIGMAASSAATVGCVWIFWNEPKMPNSLLK